MFRRLDKVNPFNMTTTLKVFKTPIRPNQRKLSAKIKTNETGCKLNDSLKPQFYTFKSCFVIKNPTLKDQETQNTTEWDCFFLQPNLTSLRGPVFPVTWISPKEPENSPTLTASIQPNRAWEDLQGKRAENPQIQVCRAFRSREDRRW